MKKAMNKKGFTLVEIMIVVAIIGLLAAIGIPSFQKARANTMAKSAVNNARLILGAADQYSMENGLAEGDDVEASQYMPYIKGCTASDNTGLKVGAINVTTCDNVNGTETAEDLAAELYPTLFD